MCVDGERLVVPDGGLEIAWRKYVLSYFADGEKGSSGWVMHEYAITTPADLASSTMRLYRIRFSGHGKKRKREPESQSAHHDDGRARCAPQIAMPETALLEDSAPPPQPVLPPAAVVNSVSDGAVPPPAPVVNCDSDVTDEDELQSFVPEFSARNLFVSLPQGSHEAEADVVGGALPAQSMSSFADVGGPENMDDQSCSGVVFANLSDLIVLPPVEASGAAPAPSWASSLDNQNDEAPVFFEFPESMDDIIGCFDFATMDDPSCTSAISEEPFLPPAAMVNHDDGYASDNADQGCSGAVPLPSAVVDLPNETDGADQSCSGVVDDSSMVFANIHPLDSPAEVVDLPDDSDGADQSCSGMVDDSLPGYYEAELKVPLEYAARNPVDSPSKGGHDHEAEVDASGGAGSMMSSPDKEKEHSSSGVMDVEATGFGVPDSMDGLSCIDFAETMDDLSCIDFTIDDELFDLWS
ncbi:hypothetical protein DAI22_07g062400 [Oryza sativa Japonica Group]|nr:hypothetical protein DAI22_07g062400 [Oryza sativa Japonica Group]